VTNKGIVLTMWLVVVLLAGVTAALVMTFGSSGGETTTVEIERQAETKPTSGTRVTTTTVGAKDGSRAQDPTLTPRLTRHVPGIVELLCEFMKSSSPIRVVCPPLIPVSAYRRLPGVHGGETGAYPGVKPPRNRLYLVGFNAGDTGPRYWHWIAGMGTPEAIQYWDISDARNVVRGKPKRIRVVTVDGRRVEIWRFPDHPAGGMFGGHYAAITTTGRLRAIASIHGDNAEGSARMAVALAKKAARGG